MPDESPWSRPPSDEEADDAVEAVLAPLEDAGDVASDGLEAILDDGPAAPAAQVVEEVAAAEPAQPVGAAPAAPRPTGGSNAGAWLLPVFGMMLLLLSALVAALVAFLTKDDTSRDYPAGRGDDEYNLQAMQLRNSDLPDGMERQTALDRLQFDNEQWATLLVDDPEQVGTRKTQLDALKRVKNQVAVYGWKNGATARLGESLSILSQSTLYEDVESAETETRKFCGLRIDEKDENIEFKVPSLADQSVGFTVKTIDQQQGSTVQTVVCFRTGRVVHGVIQQGFAGSEDPALAVAMARKMLHQVDLAFDGKPAELDPDPEDG